MLFRALTLAACLFLLGCENNRTHLDVSEVYATALSELAPAITHYTVAAEKVDFGTDEFAPDMEKINEYGIFRFPDTESMFTVDDFPGLSVTLLYDKDFDELDSDDCETFWKNFRSKHKQSTGFLRLSRVGFTESGTEAIFYVAGQGGCLAGKGTLVLMKREGESWVVALEHLLWVS